MSLYLEMQYLQLTAADVGGPSFSLHVDALAYRCQEPSGSCVTVQDILKMTQTREKRMDWGGAAVGVKHFVYVVRLPEVWTVLRLSVCGMPLSI